MALHAQSHGMTQAAVAAVGACLVALAGGLAGCVQQRPAPQAQAPLPQTLETAGGFFFSRDREEGAKLVYGREGSDDVWLMLLCRPGARDVEITDAHHPEAKAGQMLVLGSGKMQSPLQIRVEANLAANDGALAIARAPTSLPALDGFRHSGLISVKLGARQYLLSANAREKPAVARFFSACERK
jgi:Flp pilus assembly protein TadD